MTDYNRLKRNQTIIIIQLLIILCHFFVFAHYSFSQTDMPIISCLTNDMITLPITIQLDEETHIQFIELKIRYDSDVLISKGISLEGSLLSNYKYYELNSVENLAGYMIFGTENYLTSGIIAYIQFQSKTTESSGIISLDMIQLNYSSVSGGFDIKNSTSKWVRISVRLPGVTPHISPIFSQVICEDQSSDWIQYTVTDEDTPINQINVQAVSSNPYLIPNNHIQMIGTGTERAILLTPIKDQHGMSTITLSANDGIYAITESFSIVILEVNDPPSFQKGLDQIIKLNDGYQEIQHWAYDISTGADNEMDQDLRFICTTSNNELFLLPPVIDPITGTLTYYPEPNTIGEAIVSVYLKDNGGTINGGIDQSPIQSFRITITEIPSTHTFDMNVDGKFDLRDILLIMFQISK